MEILTEETTPTLDENIRIAHAGMAAFIRVLFDGSRRHQPKCTRRTIGERIGWTGTDHVESLTLVLELGRGLRFFGWANSHYFVTDELLADLKSECTGDDPVKALEEQWDESAGVEPASYNDGQPQPETLRGAILGLDQLSTEQERTQPFRMTTRPTEELKDLSLRQAAKLFAKWRGIEVDPSRISKEIKSGKIKLTADDRLTAEAVALRVVELPKQPPTLKTGTGRTCPECGEPTRLIYGSASLCFKCFDENYMSAE